MKRTITLLTILLLVVFMVGCENSINPIEPQTQNNNEGISLAKKPLPSLRCTTEYDFQGHLGIVVDGRLLVWEGPISGDITGIIKWWAEGEMLFTGQASHYKERFEIWNAAATVLLLAGDEAGTTTTRHGKNSNWRTNGTVTEAAPEYEEWIGRKNHAEGHFTWIIPGVFPDQGYGTFRVN